MTDEAREHGRTFIEGLKKVTGKAKYILDLELPGMLVGKFLYSEYPHARSTRIADPRLSAGIGYAWRHSRSMPRLL